MRLEIELTPALTEQLRSASEYIIANKADEHNGRMVLDEEDDWMEYLEVNPSFERKAKYIASVLLNMLPTK